VDIEKYRQLFVDEATDHVAEMSRALAQLESREGGDAEGAIDTLFRMAHSIKGMASSLEYESVASLAHCLEDWLEPLREAGMLPDSALPLLYEVVAVLEQMVVAVAEGGSPPDARSDIQAKLAQPLDLNAPAEEAGESRKKDPSSVRPLCRAPFGCVPKRSIASWPQWVS